MFGVPAHPFFVHLPVVLVPLAFVSAVVMLVRPSWWERLKWPTLVVAAIGTLGAFLAAGSGEELEEAVEDTAVRSLLRDHTEAGESARMTALVFFVILVAVVFAPRIVKSISSKKWWRPVVAVAIVASGGVASWSMYDAGHSGAKSVWNDVQLDDEGDHDDEHDVGDKGDHDENLDEEEHQD